MRLQSLGLEYFGHFTGKHFDFGNVSEGDPDFHVIYGPNEAGKTTFMEAYLRLLYGFRFPKEPYDFKHQRENLKLSGTLQIDGINKHYQRLPARKTSLLDENDTPLSETAMQAHLSGLSLDGYRNLLCIDDETIEKGGEEIVNSHGDIGTLLFSTSAGIGDPSSVMGAVRETADTLYKKRSPKTRLLKLKAQHKDLEARVAELDVSAAQYKRLKSQLTTSQKSEHESKQHRSDLQTEQLRLQKQLDAVPLLAEIDALEATIAPLQHYPLQLDTDAEKLVDEQTSYRSAVAEVTRLNKELVNCRQQIESLSSDEVSDAKMTAVADALQQLEPLHARNATALLNLDSVNRQLDDATHNLQRAASDILDEESGASELLVSPATIALLSKSLGARNDAVRDAAKANMECQHQEEALKRFQDTCAELNAEDAQGMAVAQLLDQYNARSLVKELQSSQEIVDDAHEQWQQSLDALAIKGQHFTDAPVCSLHSDEVDDKVSAIQALQLEIDAKGNDVADKQTELQSLLSEIDRLQSIDGLVDDEQLAQLQAQRTSAWQTHRKSLDSGSADHFERYMLQLDAAMEGRLRNVADLAALRQLQQRLITGKDKVDALSVRLADLQADKSALEARIANCVRQAGLRESISPAVAKRWVLACEQAAEQASRLKRIIGKQQPVIDRAEQCRLALIQHLTVQQGTLSDVVDAAAPIQIRYANQQQLQAKSRSDLTHLQSSLDRDRKRASELTLIAEQADLDWHSSVAESFPVSVDSVRLEASISSLHEIREHHRACETARQQCDSMEQDTAHFQKEVEKLATSMNLAVLESAEQTWCALKDVVSANLQERKQAEQVREKIESIQVNLRSQESILRAIDVRRDELAQQFNQSIPTGTIEDLRKAVQATQQVINKRNELAQAEQKLLSALEIADLHTAREYISELNETELKTRLDELAVELAAMEDVYKKAIEQRARHESDLAQVVGDSSVAELVQQRDVTELEMVDVAMQHLRLSIGHRLASTAILRFRDNHRSQMLISAEQAFSELTNGKYTQLKAQHDGKSEKLVAVVNGVPVQAKELSKGTRFQLYLALRAAAYDHLVSQGTCLPFICDDIFETFDEQRTRAACLVMQRIGRAGQAIYLTHHQHVVEIAREACADNVRIHTFL